MLKDRRHFMKSTLVGVAAVAPALSSSLVAAESTKSDNDQPMRIVIASDKFALPLLEAVKQHLISKGHEVVDVGASESKATPHFDSAPVACKRIQEKKADRGILICGTGMGMSIIANKFHGIIASCVESVYAAKMCRAINNANVLCLGGMIWGPSMACDAVDAFLTTNMADGLPDVADFLVLADKKIAAIDDATRK